MGRDLLTETIAAVADYDYTTEEEDASTMSYPPSYSAGSCPEQAGDITINQTIFQVGDGSGIIRNEVFTDETGTELDPLEHTPVAGFAIQVSLNGVVQAEGTDFTLTGDVVTLIGHTIVAEDIIVIRYAYEVEA